MKTITATVSHHVASMGPIEAGDVYEVEDDVAERWVRGGVATAGGTLKTKTAAPPPEPEPETDNGEEKDDEGSDKQARAKALEEQGYSQQAIADELGVSRSSVRRLLGL